MKSKLLILILNFVLLGNFAKVISSEKKTEKLPVINIQNNKHLCIEVAIIYDRDLKNTTPLKLETPTLGSKEKFDEIRASTLQAALIAGLSKNDTLNGITLSFESKDKFDGESISGIASLAILAFLNKTALPNDIAFIGKLMPDGSIGNENHLPEKIRALALFGKNRIIVPLNNDKNANNKIITLGKELGIELIVARNLEEAYDKIFGLKKTHIINEKVLQRPEWLKNFLIEKYKLNLELGDKTISMMPVGVINELKKDSFFNNLIFSVKNEAKTELIAGHLEKAADLMEVYSECSYFFKIFKSEISDILTRDLSKKEKCLEVSKKIEKQIKDAPSIISEIKALISISESPDELIFNYGTIGSHHSFFQLINSPDINIDKLNEKNNLDKEILDNLLLIEVYNLYYSVVLNKSAEFIEGNIKTYQKTINKSIRKKLNKENLISLNSTLESYAIASAKAYSLKEKEFAIKSKVKIEDLRSRFRDLHGDYLRPILMNIEILEIQDFLKTDLNGNAKVLSLMHSIDTILYFYINKLKLLDFSWEKDNSDNYKITDLDRINDMLIVARGNALKAIEECNVKGIDCSFSICKVNHSDASIEKQNSDKFNVLRRYLFATLTAKALLIIYSEN